MPLSLAVVFLGTCDSDPTEVVPAMGVLEVTTVTEEAVQLPDSFNIFLNGVRSGSIGQNDTFLMTFLPKGGYLVGLSGEPEHCRVPSNPRTVTVELNDTTFTTFLVVCESGS